MYEIPVPGIPTVWRTFPWPIVTFAPFGPKLVLTPDLLKFSETPGSNFTRFENRNPMANELPMADFGGRVCSLEKNSLCKPQNGLLRPARAQSP